VNWAFEDAAAGVDDLNQLMDVDLPALYADLAQQHVWPTRVAPIARPVRRTLRQ
jgi:hypothetical protein